VLPPSLLPGTVERVVGIPSAVGMAFRPSESAAAGPPVRMTTPLRAAPNPVASSALDINGLPVLLVGSLVFIASSYGPCGAPRGSSVVAVQHAFIQHAVVRRPANVTWATVFTP
jgi:hypothetical protein